MSVKCRLKKPVEYEAMQWTGDNTEKFLEWLKIIHPGIKVEQRTYIDDLDIGSVGVRIPTSKPYIAVTNDVTSLPICEGDFLIYNKTKDFSYTLTEEQFNREFEVVEIK